MRQLYELRARLGLDDGVAELLIYASGGREAGDTRLYGEAGPCMHARQFGNTRQGCQRAAREWGL
jgi:hypothetical protein